MVAITGDIVDGSVAELTSHTEPLGNLTSRHGTYVVTGNHEYYSGAFLDRRAAPPGARVLMNEHVVLEHEGAHIAIAGVTDYSAHTSTKSHRSDPRGAVAGAPQAR
jgi:predicted MPP superfamily phosphohydrolase